MMIYLPLACFVLILLFPFYWMAITSFKPNAELLNYKEHNPFWITSPTLAHIKHLLFNTAYPTLAEDHDDGGGLLDLPVAVRLDARGLCDRAAALPRQPYASGSASTSPIWCRPRSCSSRWPP